MKKIILIIGLLIGFVSFGQISSDSSVVAIHKKGEGLFEIGGVSIPSSDNQQITNFSIASNILTLTLENGGTETVDLSSYLDNENVASGIISGTDLVLTLTDASTVTIDMSSFSGGTDDQNATEVPMTGYIEGTDETDPVDTDNVAEAIAKIKNQLDAAVISGGGVTAEQAERNANIPKTAHDTISGNFTMADSHILPPTPNRAARFHHVSQTTDTITDDASLITAKEIPVIWHPHHTNQQTRYAAPGTRYQISGYSTDYGGFQSDSGLWYSMNVLNDTLIEVGGNVIPIAYDNIPPPQVGGLSSPSQTESSVTISWTAVADTGGSGLDEYEGRVDSGSATPLGNVTSHEFTGLPSPSTSYGFEIRAKDLQGNYGPWSAVFNQSTSAGASYELLTGTAFNDGTGGGDPALGYDGNTGNFYSSSGINTANVWGVNFGSSKYVHEITGYPRGGFSTRMNNCAIEGYNGSTWVAIVADTGTDFTAGSSVTYPVGQNFEQIRWRQLVTSTLPFDIAEMDAQGTN